MEIATPNGSCDLARDVWVTEEPRGASGHGEQARPQTDRAPDAGRRVDGRQSPLEGCDDDTPRQGRATGAGSGGRDFAAVGPDKLWLADITFVPTATVNDLATLLQSQVANERPEVRLCTAIMRVVYWWLAYSQRRSFQARQGRC